MGRVISNLPPRAPPGSSSPTWVPATSSMDRAALRRLRALRRQLAQQPCAGDGDELEEGDLRVAPEPLRAVVRRVLDAAGCEAEQQAVVADHLVLCNLTGHDSHGVQMLPAYIHGVHGGYLVPNKGIAIAGGGDGGPMLTIDGQDAEGKRGFGQSMCREATLLAIERAREHGVCVMGLRRSHHVGRMGTCASLPPPPPPRPAFRACGGRRQVRRAVLGGRDGRHLLCQRVRPHRLTLRRERLALRHQPVVLCPANKGGPGQHPDALSPSCRNRVV